MKTNFSIIITDDDRDDQEFFIEAIAANKIECDITSAYDGKQLMDLLLKNAEPDSTSSLPDLIILDLNMPLMDGYEVLSRIKKDDNLKHLPVCVVTTSQFDYDKTKAMAYGANGFYSKPMSNHELPKIVKQIFAEHLHLQLT